MKSVLVTGGAGYVGSALVPALLDKGYQVKVIDLMIYGQQVLDAVKDHANLEVIKGDIRDRVRSGSSRAIRSTPALAGATARKDRRRSIRSPTPIACCTPSSGWAPVGRGSGSV